MAQEFTSETQIKNAVWFDFICPFCYIAQDRERMLADKGILFDELPYEIHPEIHPEIDPSGKWIGPRQGAMYLRLERDAKEAGLPLSWPERLPNSRLALRAAAWVRKNSHAHFAIFKREVFAAHFAHEKDIGSRETILLIAEGVGIDSKGLAGALDSQEAETLLRASERLAREVGISGTPAWLVNGRLVSGLSTREDFARVAQRLAEKSAEA